MLCNFPGGAVILGHIKCGGMASEKLAPNYTYYILFNLNWIAFTMDIDFMMWLL